MKKKVVALMLTFALAAAIAGCGGGSSASKEPAKGGEAAQEDETPGNTDQPSAENQDKSLGTGYNELAPLMTYEEFAAAQVGSPVTIESYVQVKNAFDDQKSAVTLYAQDEEGAYLICDLPITQEQYDTLETGQKIRVSGDKNEEAGEVRIVNATGMIALDIDCHKDLVFYVLFDEVLTEVSKDYANLITTDIKEDPDMVYAKATLDRELQQYVGGLFLPYEERYK